MTFCTHFLGEEDDEEKSLQVVVRMYVVHPKSLRGCIISFDPPSEAKKSMSISSEDTLGKNARMLN